MLSNIFINRNYDTCVNNVYEEKKTRTNNSHINDQRHLPKY